MNNQPQPKFLELAAGFAGLSFLLVMCVIAIFSKKYELAGITFVSAAVVAKISGVSNLILGFFMVAYAELLLRVFLWAGMKLFDVLSVKSNEDRVVSIHFAVSEEDLKAGVSQLHSSFTNPEAEKADS
jgi:hypothetical protein